MVGDADYRLDADGKVTLERIFESAGHDAPGFGNGRYARTLFEQAINRQALRLSQDRLARVVDHLDRASVTDHLVHRSGRGRRTSLDKKRKTS